jgi:hypothetical protein
VCASPQRILFGWAASGARYVLSHRALSYALAAVCAGALLAVGVAGPSSAYVLVAREVSWFVLWWLTLGVLSSVGLGTGLHTFVLYLGPYIAMATLAVTECDTMSVALSGPTALVCPEVGTPKEAVTFVRILMKVLPASF